MKACPICGKEIVAKCPSELARRKYCSMPCRNKADHVTVERNFWGYVQKGDGCWEWMGARYTLPSLPYGQCNKKFGESAAHRLSWVLHNGPIPKGFSVLHKCDNAPCVRPDHLFLGTLKDNSRDAINKNRQAHRLSAADVTDIRRMRANGIRLSFVAAQYGIRVSSVQKIQLGISRPYLSEVQNVSA